MPNVGVRVMKLSIYPGVVLVVEKDEDNCLIRYGYIKTVKGLDDAHPAVKEVCYEVPYYGTFMENAAAIFDHVCTWIKEVFGAASSAVVDALIKIKEYITGEKVVQDTAVLVVGK
jgi:hypothetical protein